MKIDHCSIEVDSCCAISEKIVEQKIFAIKKKMRKRNLCFF